MWQIRLRPSQLKSASPRWRSKEIWEEWVSNEREKKEPSVTLFLWDFLLRLGDRVKTDERNGCQNEREERKNGRSAKVFLWEPLLRLGDGVQKDERNGYQMREREDERSVAQGVFVGNSIFDFAQDNRFSFSPY